MKRTQLIPQANIDRFRVQGFTQQSKEEISELAFGLRFAIRMCTSLFTIGYVTQNMYILSLVVLIAIGGVILPNHPFDYIYNQVLSKRMNRPKLPPRSKQIKFACGIASLWTSGLIWLFSAGFENTGLILGGIFFALAFLVSTTDYCVPSVIYNYLFGKEGALVANTCTV